MPTALVDSNLWLHGLTTARDPTHAALHRAAEAFLQTLLADPAVRIAVTSYQIAEILDLLRKSRYPEPDRLKLAQRFRSSKFLTRDVSSAAVFECFDLSSQSGIHIYDYLVALPLKGVVDRIYSADDHFQHPHFAAIAPVENPVAPWRLREGVRPVRG